MRQSVCIILFLLLINSCNQIAKVGIKSLGFGDEVELLQNLNFEFTQDLVAEVDLNKWQSTKFLDFEPKIEGKFKWIGKRELVFSPSKPLRFATTYTAKLNPNLVSRKKGLLQINNKEIVTFATPTLKIIDYAASIQKNALKQNENHITINFNSHYDSHNIKEDLKLLMNNKPIEYQIVDSENNHQLILALPQNTSINSSINLQFNADASNPNKFKEPQNVEIELADNNRLEVLKVNSYFKKLKGYIQIYLSQPVDSKVFESNLSIVPSTKYTLENNANGILIKGEFNQNDLYKISLAKSLVGTLGGQLDDSFETEAYFGYVSPYLEFANQKAQYISSKGSRNIGINIVNVPKVAIKIAKVYENNILPFLKSGERNYYDEESNMADYLSDDNQTYSDLILEKNIESSLLPAKQGVSILNLPLPDHKNSKGIYFISVRSEDEYYQSAQKIVAVSDIGLISKTSQKGDDLIVFANSIMNTQSLANVKVKAISGNNQTLAEATTNANGIAMFKNIKKDFPKAQVAMITATTDDDFNYILFSNSAIETSSFDVGGKTLNTNNIDAFIYGDREIYRPGETVHFNTVVRDYQWNTKANLPIKIKLKQPNGKEYFSVMANTNINGAFAQSIKIDRTAITGFYTLDIFTADDQLIGSKSISIEDFMPDRIKVILNGQESAKTGVPYILNIQANNLFGPPANDRKFEVDFQLKKKRFEPVGFAGYKFDIEDNTKYEKELITGITDAKGMANTSLKIAAEYQNKGLLEGKAIVSVFDETGRPVHRQKTFDVFTQNFFYGIKIPNYFSGTHIPLNIEMVSLNSSFKHAGSEADIEISLLDYQTILEKTEEGLRYVSKKKEKLLKTQKIIFNGKKEVLNFIPKISGEYQVKVTNARGSAPVYSYFYAYGGGTKASFEVDTDGEVNIETSQKAYNTGQEVKAIFKTPFDGKLLITVENEGIIENVYLETKDKSAEWSFKVDAKHVPNVYITATLIRAMNQPEMPLMSAHGLAAIKIDDPATILPLTINASSQSRSLTKQKITINTLPNTELTIAVVDEGILQLKNTETPNIHQYFYQKRAISTQSYDLYPLLLPEIQLQSKSSTGGDGGMGKRVNPLANGRAELLAKWSGIIKTNASGNATFDVELPDFLGAVRVMAVAYNQQKFASAEHKMLVSDPISISVGVPQYLSLGDNVAVPITFFNTTAMPQTLTLASTTEGNIKSSEFTIKTITVPAKAEYFMSLDITGGAVMGVGKLKILAKGVNETFSKTAEIGVRPAGSLQKMAESGQIAKEKVITLKTPDSFLPGTVSSKVFVGANPQMQFGFRLDNLLEYPHGCTEQTISKVFPQIFFKDLSFLNSKIEEKLETGNSDLNVDHNINAAIEKIENLQLYDGGLAYWAGNTESNHWASIYALHFLIEAQKNGYNVNPKFISNLENYITNITNEEVKMEAIFMKVNNIYKPKARYRSEIFYGLYVLSLTDNPNIAVMNKFKAEFSKLSNDHQFMLACAYKQAGDDANFAKLLPKTFINENYDKMLSGSFSSPIRSLALVLNSLLETDSNHFLIPNLSNQIATILSNKSIWLNTQELSFSLMAMGKMVQKAQKSKGTVDVIADGKIIKTITAKGEWLDLTKYPAGVTLKGQTEPLYYYWESEGIRKDNKYIAEDKGLKVRRSYYTRTGEALRTPNFALNQLIVVKLTLSTIGIQYKADNVVLTDMLPAGLEVENPRLVSDREMPWIVNAASAYYFDIRQDRINFFVEAEPIERHYYYVARAVSKGAFERGPVSADAMYNASLHSYWGGGKVVIE